MKTTVSTLYCFFIFLGIMLMNSCQSSSDSSSPADRRIVLEYNEILQEKLLYSELFSDYEFIKLSSEEDNSIFGEISKVRSTQNRIVIFDKEITNAILVYDTEGNYIFSTENGEAPSNTSLIEDFKAMDSNPILVRLKF